MRWNCQGALRLGSGSTENVEEARFPKRAGSETALPSRNSQLRRPAAASCSLWYDAVVTTAISLSHHANSFPPHSAMPQHRLGLQRLSRGHRGWPTHSLTRSPAHFPPFSPAAQTGGKRRLTWVAASSPHALLLGLTLFAALTAPAQSSLRLS